MTAPDHRPYLLPTDLREIGDVLRVLWIHGDGKAIEAWQHITDRMNRERRQACRRGARYEITMARAFWRAGGGVQALLARAHVERAFAFRAAARTP